MTDAIRELFELLTKKEKSGSDYTGRVTRVDGKTAYVQFDGSDITDTPVALSIGAKAGDSVRVRVADGRAWLVGNDDAPPNDSSEVGYQLDLTNARIRELTTEQINGENGWINLLQGTFNYGNRLIWNGSILSLIGKIETSEGRVAGWVIGVSTISSGVKGANTALVTLKSGTSGSITVENTYFKSLLDYNGLAMTGDYGETQLTNTGIDIRRKYLGDNTWFHTYITGDSIQLGDSPTTVYLGGGEVIASGDISGANTEMVSVTPTVGNGTIMTLSSNTTHKKLNQVFINCAVTFSGSRASGSLLLRLPMALQRTQYITVNKNGSASYMSSFAAGGNGVADCNCPVAFASGDIAYITGVVTLD